MRIPLFITILSSVALPIITSAGVISDAPSVAELAVSVMRFVVSIIGVIAVLGFLVAGIFYMTAGGSEQRTVIAKKILVGSVIGVVIALASLMIVNAIIHIV